jgi:hypothetical protein
MNLWNRCIRKKLARNKHAAQEKAKQALRRKVQQAGKTLPNLLERMFALESLDGWKYRVRKWFTAVKKAHARNGFARAQRRLTLESLETRQMLSITVAPSLTVSADRIAAGTSVDVSAAMPSDATGSVQFTKGGYDVGSPVTLASVHTLQLNGDGSGVSTNVVIDPVSDPNVTLTAWVRVDGATSDPYNPQSIVGCFDGTAGSFWPGIGIYANSGTWSVPVGGENWHTSASTDVPFPIILAL